MAKKTGTGTKVLIGVAVVAVAGGLGYYFYSKSKKNGEADGTQRQTDILMDYPAPRTRSANTPATLQAASMRVV